MKVNRINQLNQAQSGFKTSGVQNFNGLASQESVSLKGGAECLSNYSKAKISAPYATISFAGKNTTKKQMAFVGAELPPYCKAGGVAVVMNDYKNFSPEGRIFIPYYNGSQKFDPQTGNVASIPGVHRVTIGDRTDVPVYTNADLSTMSIEEAVAKGNFFELEEVSTKSMQFGKESEVPIGLYQVKGTNHYMVYSPKTAAMPKPYAGGIAYASDAVSVTNGWEGDPYAQFDKAFVELLPELDDKGFSPETVICSDAQSSYIPQHMAAKNLQGDEYYQGMKASYVGHNVGNGYTGYAGGRQMLVNMGATIDEINAIEGDPEFLKAMMNGDGAVNEYFQKFMPELYDKNAGCFSPTLAPFRYAQQGYVSSFDVVAGSYAEAIRDNRKTSPVLYDAGWAQAMQEGKVGGILNGLEDKTLNPYSLKDLPRGTGNPLVITSDGKAIPADIVEVVDGKKVYKTLVADKADPSKKVAQVIDDIQEVIPEFRVFTEGSSYEDMIDVKNYNKANIFRRLSGAYTQPEVINGLCNGRAAYIIGGIDEKYAKMVENGEPVSLVVSWGRADAQKGIDITLDSWAKFAKTAEGKNSVLVAGATLTGENNGAIPVIKSAIERIQKDPDLAQRFVFIDGFAPAKGLSSAGDIALFTSRFEPCGLTDLEAMRYFCTPVVTNTHGFAQKNFDPRVEADAVKATSYKTTHEYFLEDSLVKSIREAFSSTGTPEARKAVAEQFPDVDVKVFEAFGRSYDKMIETETLRISKRSFATPPTPEQIRALAVDSVMNSPAYSKAEAGLCDSILVDEFAAALKAQATQPREIAERIFKNQVNLDTSWNGNGALNPGGISSHDLYQQRHIDPDPVKPQKSLLEDIKSILPEKPATSPEVKPDVDDAGIKVSFGGIMDKVSKYIADMPKGAKYGAIGAAAAIVAGGAYAIYKNSLKEEDADAQPTQTAPQPAPSVAPCPVITNQPAAAPAQAVSQQATAQPQNAMANFISTVK